MIRREGDDAAIVVEGPFPADAQVSVDPDDVFVAFRDGAVLGAVGPGRHAPGVPFDLGVFVKRTPQSFRLGRHIGNGGGMFGTVRILVDDATAFLAALADPRAVHAEGLQQAVVESAGTLIERLVQLAIENGASFATVAADPSDILGRATEQWPVPGTRVDLSDMALSASEAASEEASSEESSDETSLIGTDVLVTLAGGRRARGTIEQSGYLVRLENGQTVWAAVDEIEIE